MTAYPITQSPDYPITQSPLPNNDTNLHLIEGVYYLVDQDLPKRAIRHFEKVIQSDPEHPDAYYFLGVSYYQVGQAELAPQVLTDKQIAYALFYLTEAEKRGVHYDAFRPNLLSQIQEKYPTLQPVRPTANSGSGVVGAENFTSPTAQVIVESITSEWGTLSVQSLDGVVEYRFGDAIPLEAGKRYSIGLKRKGMRQFLKPLLLVGSVAGILILR